MDTRLDRMATTPSALAQLVVEASDGLLDTRPADGGWSARTVLAHLRDDEYLCMRPALERALAEDCPDVLFIDGADWEPTRNRTRERREWLLADFALHRQASLAILRALQPQDWQRTMRHSQLGTFSLTRLVDAWVEHDAIHIAQIESLVGETVQEVLARHATWPGRPPTSI